MSRDMSVDIVHLFERPELVDVVARWIHAEWWADKPGHSVAMMSARLEQADDPNALPLSLIALRDGALVGTVNLVENDNEERPDLSPWLAALLVAPDARGQAVGSALVRAIVAEAARLECPRVYLGTDIPDYYLRLGASLCEEFADGYRIMSLDTRAS